MRKKNTQMSTSSRQIARTFAIRKEMKSLVIMARTRRTSTIDCHGRLTSRGLKDKLRFAVQHCVKRMKDGTIIFQFPARNFSDNIDFVLNADFTSGLEGTKEPQTVTRKRNVPLHCKHWRTTDIGAFDTGSSPYVYVCSPWRRTWPSDGCVSAKWVREYSRLCAVLYTRCTSTPILLYVSLTHRRGGKLGSLSVSIFQSRRVMSASRRQAVVALTGRSCQDSWGYRWRKYSRCMRLSRFLPYLPSLLGRYKQVGEEEGYARVHDFTYMYI